MEALIEELEGKIADTEAEMCKPENLTNHVLLAELAAKNDEFKGKLEAAYDSYLEL